MQASSLLRLRIKRPNSISAVSLASDFAQHLRSVQRVKQPQNRREAAQSRRTYAHLFLDPLAWSSPFWTPSSEL
eukprot:204513-Rhodomonas_salina.4